MILYLLINLLLYSSNSIEVHINYSDCISCNIPKINSLIECDKLNNYEKNIVLYHYNKKDIQTIKKKLNANIKIDTINKINESFIRYNIKNQEVKIPFNQFYCDFIREIEYENDITSINEDEYTIDDINNIKKIDTAYYLIANNKKEIYKIESNKFINLFQLDSIFTINNIKHGLEFKDYVLNNNIDFSVFEIHSFIPKNKGLDLIYRAIDSIEFNKKENDILVKYNYFRYSNGINNRIYNLKKTSYFSIINPITDYHIIQNEDFEESNNLFSFIKDNKIDKRIEYSQLNLKENYFLSEHILLNNSLYLNDLINRELITYDLSTNEISKKSLVNFCENIHLFDHLISNQNYANIISDGKGEIYIHIYDKDFELINFMYIGNPGDIVLFNIIDLKENSIKILFKHKHKRWFIKEIKI